MYWGYIVEPSNEKQELLCITIWKIQNSDIATVGVSFATCNKLKRVSLQDVLSKGMWWERKEKLVIVEISEVHGAFYNYLSRFHVKIKFLLPLFVPPVQMGTCTGERTETERPIYVGKQGGRC